MKEIVNKYEGFIFDLDGTIYRGEKAIPNAKKTICAIRNMKKKIVFASNKTTGSIKDYKKMLLNFGIPAEENDIITSTSVIKNYLIKNNIMKNVYALGEKKFIGELEKEGVKFSEDPKKISAIIVTLDRTVNFEKLEIAAKALENGAKFFAANIDDSCPVEGGEILDAGAIIAALEKKTKIKLEKHFGKPSKYMFEEVIKKLNAPLNKCLIIGDRLETDIAMGNIFNVDTAIVMTGVKSNGNGHYRPNYTLNSVYDLIK